jgi:hypothetical protein
MTAIHTHTFSLSPLCMVSVQTYMCLTSVPCLLWPHTHIHTYTSFAAIDTLSDLVYSTQLLPPHYGCRSAFLCLLTEHFFRCLFLSLPSMLLCAIGLSCSACFAFGCPLFMGFFADACSTKFSSHLPVPFSRDCLLALFLFLLRCAPLSAHPLRRL